MLMEKQTLAARRSIVRYGNVLGSRGSLIPFLMQCVQNRASIPITDPEMTRFWLHLQDAVDLVISAWTDQLEGVSGIHVPLAPAMRVIDLVAALAPNNLTHYCGIMPGEKLHEAMVAPDEAFCCYEWDGRLLLTQELAPSEANPVDRGFTYTSQIARHLTKDELIAKLADLDLVDNELVIRREKCVSQ
jgi:UDP-N-acetylglucosamine 4,6-dehydratase